MELGVHGDGDLGGAELFFDRAVVGEVLGLLGFNTSFRLFLGLRGEVSAEYSQLVRLIR